MNEGHHRDVPILKSESDHLARKVGVVEQTLRFLATNHDAQPPGDYSRFLFFFRGLPLAGYACKRVICPRI